MIARMPETVSGPNRERQRFRDVWRFWEGKVRSTQANGWSGPNTKRKPGSRRREETRDR